MSDLLKEADHIVSGDRAGDYGENSLPAIARLWSEHVGSEITARDVAWMMVLLKSVRDRHKEKRDNLVDAIGYIQLAEVNETPKTMPRVVQGPVKGSEMIIPAAEALSPNGQNFLKAMNEANTETLEGFKVGDHVRVVSGAFHNRLGREGKIVGINDGFLEMADPEQSDGKFSYFPHELAHVTE